MSSQHDADYLAEYSGGQLLVASTVILVIATVLLALRLYARSLTVATYSWEEFLLPPSWVFLVGLAALLCATVPLAGVGRHIETVSVEDPQKLVTRGKLFYTLNWFYASTNAISRCSVVMLYLRVFTNKVARFCCWVVLVFLVLNGLSIIIAANLQCMPLAYTWDKTIPGGSCFNLSLWFKIPNILNIAGDVAVMLLPVRTVWMLKISFDRKAGLALVCLTGSIGLISSCIRTKEFFRLSHENNVDSTWAAVPLLSWTIVESGMYFSAACIIGLRPLLSRAGAKTIRDDQTPGNSSSQRSAAAAAAGGGGSQIRAKKFLYLQKSWGGKRSGAGTDGLVDSQSHIVSEDCTDVELGCYQENGVLNRAACQSTDSDIFVSVR